MKVFTIVLAVIFGCQTCFGAAGDEYLRGYLVAKDDSMCINTGETSAVAATDAAGIASDCTLMSLLEGTATDQYIIQEQGDATKQVTLTSGAATTFTNAGAQLTFTTEGTMVKLTTVTKTDVSALIEKTASVYVADLAHGNDNSACLKLLGTYQQGGTAADCVNQLWYFVLAACSDADCITCFPDPAVCFACDNSKVVGLDDACYTCGLSGCDTCRADGECGACTSGTEYPNSDGVCQACGTAIPGCTTCAVSTAGITTCTDCGTKVASTDGASCVTCGVTGCDTCRADGECGDCTDASHYPNAAGDTCAACGTAIDNCDVCDLTATFTTECTTCDADYSPSTDKSECESTTTTTTTESAANLHQSSLLIVMGSVLMFLSSVF